MFDFKLCSSSVVHLLGSFYFMPKTCQVSELEMSDV